MPWQSINVGVACSFSLAPGSLLKITHFLFDGRRLNFVFDSDIPVQCRVYSIDDHCGMANLYCFVFRRRGRWWGLTWQLRSANADERILGCTQIQGRFKVGIWLVRRKSRKKLLWWSPLRYFATPGYSSTMKKLKAGLHLRLRHQQNKHAQKHLYC